MEPTHNIYTDGTYYRNNPTWDVEDSVWKAELIFNLARKNRIEVSEITDVGCGAGAILKELSGKMHSVKAFKGFDISPDAIALAKKMEAERLSFVNADYSKIHTTETGLLLLIDVLEHVEDYFGFIRSLNRRAHYYIFHIPLDLSCRTLLKPHVLLQQRQAVGHLHYFSKEMILWLLKDTGYSIIDWHYTKPTGDINRPTSMRQGVKKILRNFSFSMNRHISAKLWGGYSMLILARNTNE